VTDPRLDTWLPDPAVRTHHRASAAASPDDVWDAARSVRLADTRTLGRVVRWRIPGVAADQTYRALFAREPFTVLAEGEHWSVSGLVGRIWTMRRDYPPLSGAEEFASWDRAGTARVLFAHWVEPAGERRNALVSEGRAVPIGGGAALRLRGLWTVMAPFERLIGGEALALAARRAERRASTAG
jgi:hypothetical protein